VDGIHVFYPKKRFGLFINSIIILVLLVLLFWGLWTIANSDIGSNFYLIIFPVVISILLLPITSYRLYALYNAYYTIERDGIRLRWGFRSVQIPVDIIEWVHPANDLEPPVPLPIFRWPGAILGTRKVTHTGRVEFLASTTKNMLVIATPAVAYAISPGDPLTFQQTYNQVSELGSLTPLDARSTGLGLYLITVWSSRLAKSLIIAGFILNLLLLAYSLYLITLFDQVNLGFQPGGEPRDPIPAIRLLLLPSLSREQA